jgi:hypothetical protein
MIRKLMMLAFAAALVAFAIPATASAQWTKHTQTLGQNDQIQVTGQFKFQGGIGNLECQTNAAAQLTASTTTADVTSFVVDVTGVETVTDNCTIGGGLASLGCSDVASVTSSASVATPWVAHLVSTQTIDIATGTMQNHLHGGIFCPKTQQLTPGTVTLQTGQQDHWTQGQLFGELQIHSGEGQQQVTQQAVYSGAVTITPGGTYGGHGNQQNPA